MSNTTTRNIFLTRHLLQALKSPVHCVLLLSLTVQCIASLAAARTAPDDTVVEAIWRIQRLPFEYRSLNTYYSCESLQRKVRAILQLVGAHEAVITQANCAALPATHIRIQILVATPVPATEENVRAATTFDAKDQLLAQLRQVALPTATDIERFPAQWRTRRLSHIRDLRFTHSDCDLLRGMHEQVFPKLAVRVTSKPKLSCDARATMARPDVRYEALIAVPRA